MSGNTQVLHGPRSRRRAVFILAISTAVRTRAHTISFAPADRYPWLSIGHILSEDARAGPTKKLSFHALQNLAEAAPWFGGARQGIRRWLRLLAPVVLRDAKQRIISRSTPTPLVSSSAPLLHATYHPCQ